ncbi:hypothetical protein, partial [uncultured Rikenella sp.]|uniref:hypothetical protein n=1 Tax=uncultured Rikenella sp. TaxID=368003 RepID=UPI002619EA87
LFVNKENQKNFRRMLRILKLPTTQFFVPRAWGNLVKTHKRILTISLLRRGARTSFDPARTVPFVNKRNRKNFRAHPYGMLWPGLPA